MTIAEVHNLADAISNLLTTLDVHAVASASLVGAALTAEQSSQAATGAQDAAAVMRQAVNSLGWALSQVMLLSGISQLSISTLMLNFSVSNLPAVELKGKSFFVGVGGQGQAAMVLPGTLLLPSYDDGAIVATVFWTSPANLHGIVEHSSFAYESPLVSFTLLDSAGEEIEVDGLQPPMNLVLPVPQVSIAQTCTGQPKDADLFDMMRGGGSSCEETIECRFWHEDEQQWSSSGCTTLQLNTTFAGQSGIVCSCSHLSDYVAVRVPTVAKVEEFEFASLYAAERFCMHCNCAIGVSVQLEKTQHGAVLKMLDASVARPFWPDDPKMPTNWSATRLSISSPVWPSSVPWVALSSWTGNASVPMRLAMSSHGLRETGPATGAGSGSYSYYSASVDVEVMTAVGVTHNISVPVNATVRATVVAVRSVWGEAANGSSCDAVEKPNHLNMTLNSRSFLSFTSCDADGLPVAHALPSPDRGDFRNFSLWAWRSPGGTHALTLPNSTALPEARAGLELIDPERHKYLSDGVYQVSLEPTKAGDYELLLTLGQEVAASSQTLMVHVHCPTGKVLLSTSTDGCGCDRGYEPVIRRSRAHCTKCAPGEYRRQAHTTVTSYFLLPTSYFLLPTCHFLLVISYLLLPTSGTLTLQGLLTS